MSHKLLRVSNKYEQLLSIIVGCNWSLVMKLSATNKTFFFFFELVERNVKACHTVCDGSYHLECEQWSLGYSLDLLY